MVFFTKPFWEERPKQWGKPNWNLLDSFCNFEITQKNRCQQKLSFVFGIDNVNSGTQRYFKSICS